MGAPLTQTERNLFAALNAAQGADSLLDFIPMASAARGDAEVMLRPNHLRPLADLIVRALTEPVFACVSVPPQHGKTEVLLHGIAWWLWLRPQDQLVYASYSSTFTKGKSRRALDFAQKMGLDLRRDAQSAADWLTVQGGGLMARGRGGSITGNGARLLIVDDPFSNREEAESPVIRQTVHEFLTGTVLSRRAPKGSVIVVHTRWHDDDLIGRLAHTGDWECINIPAIDDTRGGDGSLWPEFRNREWLDKQRRLVGEYDWASMYQGEPRPRGGRLFSPDPARYTTIGMADGMAGWRIVIGVDPALTEKTSADYSVAVAMAVKSEPGKPDFMVDILEVYRAQVDSTKLMAMLLNMANRWNAPLAIEAVGGFKAIPQMMRNEAKRQGMNVRIFEVTPLGDKFTRALPVAAAWNDQKVRLPAQGAAWVKDFLHEISMFTGIKDKHDDCVDAIAHGFNSLIDTKPNRSYGVQRAPAEFS